MIATIPNAVRAFLRTAELFRGVLEVPRNSNRGIVPDFCNWFIIKDWREFPMGGKGAPWCASFIGTVGRLAVGEAWPVPAICDVDQLVMWAETHDVFHETPEHGDLIVLFDPGSGQWGHVGIVVKAAADSVRTIEGNTNAGGSREGNGVYERRRMVRMGTRFIRWVNALQSTD
jgi:hypothetical protein